MSDYTSMSRTELAALCKERGIKGYSTKKKEELIAMLTEPKVEILISPSLINRVNKMYQDGALLYYRSNS